MVERVPGRASVGVLDHFEIAGFSWLGPDAGQDRVTIFVDGQEIGSVPANAYRQDLQKERPQHTRIGATQGKREFHGVRTVIALINN
jgi:hypothetical protein